MKEESKNQKEVKEPRFLLEKELNEKIPEDEEDLEEILNEESDKENPDEKISKAEMDALIEEFTTKNNQRFLQFLRDSTSNSDITNSMLLRSLESQLDDAPISRIKEEKDEEKLDYIKYEDPSKSKYQSYSPMQAFREDDPDFINKSSSERIIEQQKRITKQAFGGGYKDEKSEEREYIRPEDINPNRAPKYRAT